MVSGVLPAAAGDQVADHDHRHVPRAARRSRPLRYSAARSRDDAAIHAGQRARVQRRRAIVAEPVRRWLRSALAHESDGSRNCMRCRCA